MDILCYKDSYLKQCKSKVSEVNDYGVILDQTVFYPGGGGQPSDKGRLKIDNNEFVVKNLVLNPFFPTADEDFEISARITNTGTETLVSPANLWVNDISFLKQQGVAPDSTYIWNDRFVLHPADKLYIDGQTSANFDVFYTYLDQNWE